MKRIVVKRLYWPWSWARFSAKTRNRHTIYHSQSIYLKCRWMEPGHQFVLTQPEYSLCWKEKERKPSGPQLLPDHQRNMLPPVKDALEECDCTQCDLQDSERKLLSKSAPHRYDVKKITEQGLPFTAPVPMIDEAFGIEAIQQMIRRWPNVSTKVSASRVVSNFCSTVHMAKVSSIEHSKGRLHIECSEPENVNFVVEANYGVIWYPIPVFRTHFVDERVTEVYFPIYFDLNPT